MSRYCSHYVYTYSMSFPTLVPLVRHSYVELVNSIVLRNEESDILQDRSKYFTHPLAHFLIPTPTRFFGYIVIAALTLVLKHPPISIVRYSVIRLSELRQRVVNIIQTTFKPLYVYLSCVCLILNLDIVTSTVKMTSMMASTQVL